jgi:holliday junction DNA helicase RuvA
VIGALQGKVETIDTDRIVLSVGGVGFEVRVTPKAVQDVGPSGSDVLLHTHLHVREDALDLYGFVDRRDRDVFRLLLAASGVGPKLAMAMMGTLGTEEIRRAVVAEDAAALTVVPGIGTRSAQKLVLELRPRLAGAEADVVGSGTRAQIREALEGLGYATAEVSEVVAALPDELGVEQGLRLALQQLGRQ